MNFLLILRRKTAPPSHRARNTILAPFRFTTSTVINCAFVRIATFFILTLAFTVVIHAQEIAPQDISSIRFDSLSVDRVEGLNQLTFGIKARKAATFEPIINIRETTEGSLEYFFMGLAISDDKFWVNLNPEDKLKIIDLTLVNTDLGKVMLNADLRLKEHFCELTNPEISAKGREFWKRLYEKAGELGIADNIATYTRLWIVPDEVVVSEEGNKVFIMQSRLKVCSESEYFAEQMQINDPIQRELQEYTVRLMNELIFPSLTKKINESYSYADLRDVYQALILAKWYKQKFGYQQSQLLRTVNLNVLEDTELRFFYTSDEIYKDYLHSVNKGEYSLKGDIKEGLRPYSARVTRRYVSGGVDFRKIKIAIKEIDDKVEETMDSDSVRLVCILNFPDSPRPLRYAKAALQSAPIGFMPQNESNVLAALPTENNGTEKSLQYVQAPVQPTTIIPRDSITQDKPRLLIVLTENLPPITFAQPAESAEQKTEIIEFKIKSEKVVLSRL